MEEIEKAFQAVTLPLLNKRLSNLTDYEGWLVKDIVHKIVQVKSIKSGKPVSMPSMRFFEAIKDNCVSLEEALELGKSHLSAIEADSLSLANASSVLKNIARTTPEAVYGTNIGTVECADYGPSQYCYRSSFAWFDKFCAYSFWPRNSEYIFGCSSIIDSRFCMKCHDSAQLTRCFEVLDGSNSSDCYFCHNVENVQNGILCFNAKNLRYAVGNVEVGREKFTEMKNMLLNRIVPELESRKDFAYSIFDLYGMKASH
ncbi:MAG: hypothetical protein PHS02_04665 [Candidatus ainarchaeum sp.]|nr:hypothetical protein [Candidatus ainarchaeum sp.]